MKILLAVIAVIALPVIVGSAAYVAPRSSYSAASALPAEPTSAEVLRVAREIGLVPELLAAGGADEGDARSALAAIRESGADVESLLSTSAQQDILVRNVAMLQQQVQDDPFNEQLRGEFNRRRGELEQLATDAASLRARLFDAAVSPLAREEAEAARACRASLGRKVPLEFRVARCTTTEWRSIEEALIAERRAARLGEPLDSEYAQVLAGIRSRSEVTQASVRLGRADFGALRQAFAELR